MRMVFPDDPGYLNHEYPLDKLPRASAGNGNGLAKRPPETSTKKIVAPAQNSERGSSDSAGLFLLDRSLKPIYVSEKAVSILCYPEKPRNGQLHSFLVRRIDSLLPAQGESFWPKISHEFSSGKRLYQVRVFTLKPRLANGAGPTLAVMLERNQRGSIDIAEAAKRFRLTQREAEALRLLTQGYKTKEIASRMGISPNTAKTFLRSIMFKMGARERSGILVKILQFANDLAP